ncbi:hypothetical protein [Streptococcus moroccensis]|uniref:Uncharacterized protein n=1 Tax=Streptococcus moroccensis TaxID=1451356 RepID=A0ABT9YSS4_9STRE|nr:hypothetical protein [Streptococcus moroccensis]MDQ0222810.1 hypothetical protein [Streptococcus moroccensis]
MQKGSWLTFLMAVGFLMIAMHPFAEGYSLLIMGLLTVAFSYYKLKQTKK